MSIGVSQIYKMGTQKYNSTCREGVIRLFRPNPPKVFKFWVPPKRSYDYMYHRENQKSRLYKYRKLLEQQEPRFRNDLNRIFNILHLVLFGDLGGTFKTRDGVIHIPISKYMRDYGIFSHLFLGVVRDIADISAEGKTNLLYNEEFKRGTLNKIIATRDRESAVKYLREVYFPANVKLFNQDSRRPLRAKTRANFVINIGKSPVGALLAYIDSTRNIVPPLRTRMMGRDIKYWESWASRNLSSFNRFVETYG